MRHSLNSPPRKRERGRATRTISRTNGFQKGAATMVGPYEAAWGQAAPPSENAPTTEAAIHAAGVGGLGASALGAAGGCGAVAGEVTAACGVDPAGVALAAGLGPAGSAAPPPAAAAAGAGAAGLGAAAFAAAAAFAFSSAAFRSAVNRASTSAASVGWMVW